MTDQINLVRASEVGKLPVVTIDGGEDAAEIKDVVYDASRHHLVGFTLNKRGWFRGTMKETLATENVAGIGPDAVMIESDACLNAADSAPEQLDRTGENYSVIGVPVVSSGGAALGTVVDVVIETGPDPKAVGYEVDNDGNRIFVPTSAQMGLSGDNLVVPAEADEFVRNDLAGFGAAVSSFRDLLAGRGDARGATS
ncbi:MAG: PRC-barrel domain containing protein [Ilumatobacter sp.]|nr:PRC-barrel domain containing protein [Ilumatobacter sp.]